MMPNFNQQVFQTPYGAVIVPTPMDYFSQGMNMPGMYDISGGSVNASRNDSVATSNSMPSRNNSVTAAMAMPAPDAYLPGFGGNTAEDLIGAVNLDTDFELDDFFGDAMGHMDQGN